MASKTGGDRLIDFCPTRPLTNCLWVPSMLEAPIGVYDDFLPGHLPFRVAADLSALVQVHSHDSTGWEVTVWVAAAAHMFRDHVDDYRVLAFCQAAVDPKLMPIKLPDLPF